MSDELHWMPNEGTDCAASGKLIALLSLAVQDYPGF